MSKLFKVRNGQIRLINEKQLTFYRENEEKIRACKTLIRRFKSGRYLQSKKDIRRDVLFALGATAQRFEEICL